MPKEGYGEQPDGEVGTLLMGYYVLIDTENMSSLLQELPEFTADVEEEWWQLKEAVISISTVTRVCTQKRLNTMAKTDRVVEQVAGTCNLRKEIMLQELSF